jgi:RHS repeat-associated protein
MASYTAPDLGAGSETTEYTFDADRQLTSVLRPDSVEVTMAYDSAGRLGTVTIPAGTYAYTYSPTTGLLTGVTSPDSIGLGYTYDGSLLKRVEWSGAISGSVDVSYDNDFRVIKQRVNDGLLTGAGALTLTRSSANGLLTGTTLGSATTTQTYNGFGELATMSAAYSGNTLFQTAYTRDGLGRITRLIETVQGVTDTLDYTYDLVGRLEEVKRNAVSVESYTYDENGNRTSFTGPSGTINATYDDQDRLLSYGSTSYSYTAAGELSMKVAGTDTTRYTYDELGNLREVTLPDGTLIEYLVDGQNRRVGKKVDGSLVQAFLYGDQLNPVAELDSTGNVVARFVYGSRSNVPDYIVKGGTTYRVLADHLGGVRVLVATTSGQVAQRIDYDGFGQIAQNTDPGLQPFAFAGGLYDHATALVRFGARDYDATTGRWTAKDPVLFGARDWNLYGYSLHDPLNTSDPSGLVSCVDAITNLIITAGLEATSARAVYTIARHALGSWATASTFRWMARDPVYRTAADYGSSVAHSAKAARAVGSFAKGEVAGASWPLLVSLSPDVKFSVWDLVPVVATVRAIDLARKACSCAPGTSGGGF